MKVAEKELKQLRIADAHKKLQMLKIVIRIQAQVRGFMARMNVKRSRCATKIQSAWRRKLAYKERAALAEEEKARQAAATGIQVCWRTKKKREEKDDKRRRAAATIQVFYQYKDWKKRLASGLVRKFEFGTAAKRLKHAWRRRRLRLVV